MVDPSWNVRLPPVIGAIQAVVQSPRAVTPYLHELRIVVRDVASGRVGSLESGAAAGAVSAYPQPFSALS